MGINQAIFTSSAKGISKGGGMGIHTYSRQCSALELSEFELSYCKYYFSGDAEEIPKLPTKYVYGKTQEGRYIAAEITYLGKDYDKELGRMGNLISHMYSFEKEDLQVYPMELYGSRNFLTSIDTADVDGTNEVDYLPVVDGVDKGEAVSIEIIQEFLDAERMEMFCNLLAAVLKRDEVHKIIIYDTHEHIVKWIAAVQYALPLNSVREVTFSTYEEYPMMSEFDIRGAVAGMSMGDYEDYSATGQYYAFDGIEMRYPEFDVTSDFYQFGICMGMAYVYDALQEFYKFLKGYQYEKADEDIYKGFKLFQMAQGGMASLQGREFIEAISFEGKYGNKKSCLELLNQLTDNVGSVSPKDTPLWGNLQKLVTDFFKKELTERELSHILDIALKMDQNLENSSSDILENESMWNEIGRQSVRTQSQNLMYIMKYLSDKRVYQRLGNLQAYVLKVAKKENMERYVTRFFTGYWSTATEAELRYFDAVIEAAAKVCQALEDENEKYLRSMNMFLMVQEMGKGALAGKGCERLLQIIESETKIGDKKKPLIGKKKKDDETVEVQQAKCAFEAFNYTQRNHVSLPVSRIRLQHLYKSIVKTYEEEISMTKSKALLIYSEYPVVIEGISDEELQSFFELLADVVVTMETSRKEYGLLFQFWKLTDSQKDILTEVFADVEFGYFKKEKSCEGIVNLLGAAVDIGDKGYRESFKIYASGLKSSFKEKITEELRRISEKDVFKFWMDISREDEKNSKKGFFKFGKR